MRSLRIEFRWMCSSPRPTDVECQKVYVPQHCLDIPTPPDTGTDKEYHLMTCTARIKNYGAGQGGLMIMKDTYDCDIARNSIDDCRKYPNIYGQFITIPELEERGYLHWWIDGKKQTKVLMLTEESIQKGYSGTSTLTSCLMKDQSSYSVKIKIEQLGGVVTK